MEKALAQMEEVINSVAVVGDEVWNELKTIWQPLVLKRGEYFVEEGQRPSRLGFVSKGVLRAFYRTNEGEEYNKTFFTEGVFVAALAALVRGTESYINLQALEDTEMIVANYKQFTDLYSKYHKLEHVGRRIIEEKWIEKEHRELRLVLCSAEERYAYFRQEHPGLEHRIAQYHIASFLGITPVALSRIRSRMARDGEGEHEIVPRQDL